jgi:subtilisin family serine protease
LLLTATVLLQLLAARSPDAWSPVAEMGPQAEPQAETGSAHGASLSAMGGHRSDRTSEVRDVCSPGWIRVLHEDGRAKATNGPLQGSLFGTSDGAVTLQRQEVVGSRETPGSVAGSLSGRGAEIGEFVDAPAIGPSEDLVRDSGSAAGPHGEVPDEDPYSRYPDDPYFRLYQRESLMAIGALDAWDTSRGAEDVTVAVISTGVDYTHPDLAAKIWRNADEVPDNGVDDDGNGYIDDVRGWNFTDNDADPMDAPKWGKGSLMAGIAAADTNNGIGIAGVSWGARIMPLKTLSLREDEHGARFVGSVRDIVEAVCYAANNDADIVLIGGYLYDPEGAAEEVELLRQSIEFAHRAGAVIVAPAGDCAQPQPFCPEKYGPNPTIVPAAFTHVIGAQSFKQGYLRRDEASYGPWVDITAPGERFMTTGAGDNPFPWVKHQRATSDFAAAHIAGVVAVMRSVNPDFAPLQIEKTLCQSANRKYGMPYGSGPMGSRNDEWGCGIVDFEGAIESTPPKIRVSPEAVMHYSDGSKPWPRIVLENPYLRAGAWTVYPKSATWLLADELVEPSDLMSRAVVNADLDQLRREHGQLQSGDTVTDTLYACPLGWERDEAYDDLCQRIPYRLTFVEWQEPVYLPFAARR